MKIPTLFWDMDFSVQHLNSQNYCDFLKFLMQEMAETSYLPTAQKFLERLNCFQCAVFILLYYDNLILGYFYAQKCLTLKLVDYLR